MGKVWAEQVYRQGMRRTSVSARYETESLPRPETRGVLGRLHLYDGPPIRIGKEVDCLAEDEAVSWAIKARHIDASAQGHDQTSLIPSAAVANALIALSKVQAPVKIAERPEFRAFGPFRGRSGRECSGVEGSPISDAH